MTGPGHPVFLLTVRHNSRTSKTKEEARTEILRELKGRYIDYVKALVGKKVESKTLEHKVRQMGRWYTLAKKIGLIAIVLSDWFPHILITKANEEEFKRFADNFANNIWWIHEQLNDYWSDAPLWLKMVGCTHSHHLANGSA